MPIYDYVCRDCGTTVEVIHSVDSPGPSACANCGGSMRKALSTPAIVFKGSGWAKKERSSAARSADKAASDGGSSEKTDKAASDDGGSSEKTDKATTAPKSTGEQSTAS